MGGTRAPDAAPSAWLAVSGAWEGPVGKPVADSGEYWPWHLVIHGGVDRRCPYRVISAHGDFKA
jgi:hypothetical protein